MGGHSSPNPYERKVARLADDYHPLLLSQVCGFFLRVSGQVHYTYCGVASSNCVASKLFKLEQEVGSLIDDIGLAMGTIARRR